MVFLNDIYAKGKIYKKTQIDAKQSLEDIITELRQQ
jgi:hypothetical protein